MIKDHYTRIALYLAALWNVARRAERGQGLVEYAAILGFLAAIVVVAIHFFEPAVATSLNNVTNSF
jgi:Flp pilus assembly pilin Flp